MVSTVVDHDREAYAEKPFIGSLAATAFLLVPDAADIATAQEKDDPMHQPRWPTMMRNPRSRLTESDASPQFDVNAKHKSRFGTPFHLRERLGRALDPLLHTTGSNNK